MLSARNGNLWRSSSGPVFTDTSHSQSALWVPFKQAEVLAKADLAIGRSLALSQVDFPTRWWHVLRWWIKECLKLLIGAYCHLLSLLTFSVGEPFHPVPCLSLSSPSPLPMSAFQSIWIYTRIFHCYRWPLASIFQILMNWKKIVSRIYQKQTRYWPSMFDTEKKCLNVENI